MKEVHSKLTEALAMWSDLPRIDNPGEFEVKVTRIVALISEARDLTAAAPDQSDHARALHALGDQVVLGVTRRILAAVEAGEVGTARAWAEVAEILGRVES